ncbi:MAG: 30S ribosomal protein S6 [Elusimicrobia bacterium HGW-Elusimicrobia-3]|nr:MAG: 30S ribosomal protein S6 [Elusimicrobia bacterium HGW-Elusimicrobia-3]
MNTYELMLIINPQLTDAEVQEAVEKAKKTLTDAKGEVLAEDRLGRRKFSHEVGKQRDGFYVYMKVKALPESLKAINHSLKLQETVLRAMMMKATVEPVKKP